MPSIRAAQRGRLGAMVVRMEASPCTGEFDRGSLQKTWICSNKIWTDLNPTVGILSPNTVLAFQVFFPLPFEDQLARNC